MRPQIISVGLLGAIATAQSTGRPGHGLVGYGIVMYKPECAFACRGALPRSAIPCDIHLHGHHSSSVSAECLADSEAYLMSAAWCLSVKCGTRGEAVTVSDLESWWEMDLVGRELVQPAPRWTYQEALAQVERNPPTSTLEEDGVFNRTVLVDEDTYIATWNGNTAFEEVEINHETYGIILLVTGAAIPLFLSLLRFIPLRPSLVSKIYAYFIDPPVLGTRHAVPVLGLAITPTRGQSLFILYLIAVNVILGAVGYNSRQPHSWYSTGVTEEIINYVANRTGVLSFANLPLLILYSGRNNILLWLTNWSHSTFLLLHRWVAVICVLQACLHSVLWLHLHVAYYKDHSEVATIPYWYWGIIATVALALMLPLSVLPLRRRLYEFFHAAHIALAVLTIVGCWYHIIYRYQRQWGYETWVLVAIAVWAFEWVFRAARVARNGVVRAYLTRVDEDYLLIHVPGVDCQGHAYLYFPSLSWRIWESHPFSVAGSMVKSTKNRSSNDVLSATSPADEKEMRTEVGAHTVVTTRSSASDPVEDSVAFNSSAGITFFVRVHSGITSHLAAHAGSSTGLPVLIESSYGHESRLYPNDMRSSADYPNLIFVAGGVGITAVLPALSAVRSLYRPLGSTKLYWGVREQARGLVRSVRQMLANDDDSDLDNELTSGAQCRALWGDVDVRISVGERFDLRAVLEADIALLHRGTTVMVCGPAGMADEVRAVVSGLGRHGATVRLVEESFAW